MSSPSSDLSWVVLLVFKITAVIYGLDIICTPDAYELNVLLPTYGTFGKEWVIRTQILAVNSST